jgi:tetratricopeptide (TPR) repeat protein
MGLAAYGVADFPAAATYFRGVGKTYPLNEVFNNLGAAEGQTNAPASMEDLRRALDADSGDAIYQFNNGLALLKSGSFEEAAKLFGRVADRDPDDQETAALLERARQRDPNGPPSRPVPFRLKQNFDQIAFRQLKAMLQPKASN